MTVYTANTNNQYYKFNLELNETSYSEENNTSVVSWHMWISRSNIGSEGVFTQGTATAYIYFDGVGTLAKTLNGYDFGTSTATLDLGSGTKTINHNEDGTKTVAVYGRFNSSSSSLGNPCLVPNSGNIQFVLTNIPRNDLLSVKVSNTWKSGKAFVKVNGSWKEGKKVYVKVNGEWKESSVRG